jgi:uncharacterized protein YqhQ
MEDRIIAYGGQAVIEGVMMRGKTALAIAMRKPDGGIGIHKEKLSGLYRSKLTKVPFLRGIIMLWDALGLGIRALTIAANTQTNQDEQIEGAVLYLTLGIGLLFGLVLFVGIPAGIGSLTEKFLGWSAWWSNVLEGLVRLALLVGYIKAISSIPDIKRLYAYHGAEHKTINAFEAGADLRIKSVATYSLRHPRCGTAFLLTLVFLTVLVFGFLGPLPLPARFASRLLLIPILAGFAVEYIRWTADHLDHRVVRWLIQPNLALQALTTREPDESMIEVAIHSFTAMREAEREFAL